MGDHQFRVQLARLMADRSVTMPRLAALTSYARQYVWEVATGRKPANSELAAACDRALAARGTLVAAWEAPEEVSEAVNRRQVLVDLGALTLAAPLASTEVVRHSLTSALRGDPTRDVDEWDAIANEYACSFFSTPVVLLLRDLTADLDVLGRALASADGRTTRGLSRVGAQLSAITAKAWEELGEARHALRWWRTARIAADRSTDLDTRTWVDGWEVADGLYYEQRTVLDVLHLAAQATTLAGNRASAGAAGLYAGLAQTFAVDGNRDGALEALARVADITDQLPATVVADEASMFGWPEVRLRHTESYVHTRLGDTARAYAAQDRALEIYPQALARERAAMLMHRATCMIVDGDVAGGLGYSATVLDDLPAEHHTDLVYAVARAMLAVVPGSERGRREVRDLSGRLALPAGGRE